VRRDYFTIALVLGGFGVFAYAVFAPRDDLPTKKSPPIERISDPEAVLPQALRVLDEKISVKDGFVFITDQVDIDTYLVPVSAPWMVRCGIGASIQLGAVATGSEGTVGSQVDIWLFNNVIERPACAIVAPRIAMRLQEKLAGR
jgi:hypothetical protein